MCTHNIPFLIIKKKITPDYSKYSAMGFISYGGKNKFERVVVNEPSVFEPLKFYCMSLFYFTNQIQIVAFMVSDEKDMPEMFMHMHKHRQYFKQSERQTSMWKLKI